MQNWNQEFREIKFPSVELFLTTGNTEHSFLNIVVCRDIIEYPKYIIHFVGYLAFRSNEESGFGFDFDFELPKNSFAMFNSIVLEESPWLKSKSNLIEFLNTGKTFRHFIFVGGDNIVEIITDSDPKVSIWNEPQVFEYRI